MKIKGYRKLRIGEIRREGDMFYQEDKTLMACAVLLGQAIKPNDIWDVYRPVAKRQRKPVATQQSLAIVESQIQLAQKLRREKLIALIDKEARKAEAAYQRFFARVKTISEALSHE